MNSVNITGRIAHDLELKKTQSGKSVCSFRLAVNRPRVKDKTDWIPCTAWNQSAEFLCKYAAKGNRIEVSGLLTSRDYEDKDGNKRTAYEVLCEAVGLLESRSTTLGSQVITPVEKTDDAGAQLFSEMTMAEEEDLPF